MKVFGRVLTTLFALIVGIPLVLAVWLHFAWAAPDVNKQVKSAELRRLHAAAVALSDQGLGTFVSTAPHASKLATAVRDRCAAWSETFGAKPTTKCNREVTVYLALDGNQISLQRTWTKSLAAAGWKASNSQQYEHDSASVRLEWHTRPAPPYAIGDFQKGIPEKNYGHEVTLEEQPVDVTRVYQDAYAHHLYVVALSMRNQYYPGPPQPSPTTVPPRTGCYSGSGKCLGG